MGDLKFSFDIYFILNIGAHFVFLRLAVLADEDKAGEKR